MIAYVVGRVEYTVTKENRPEGFRLSFYSFFRFAEMEGRVIIVVC